VRAAAVEPPQTFRERLPASPLRGLVSCVWVQQVGQSSPPYLHRTIPNGSTELVCPLGSTISIVGPQTGPTEESVTPGTVTIGLRLRPGVAQALLGLPASELVDLQVEASEIWGRSARTLDDRLAAATSPQAATALLEQELLRQAHNHAPLDPLALEAVPRLLRRGTSIRSLAGSLYISERQLRRRLEAAVGIAPKPLQRVFRFQRFLALVQAGDTQPNLGRLAREAGYADQSHLSREAVRLAGRTPGTLLQHADKDCRCAHDHSASYRAFL
jgi:AraC-like DNA-binding protein